MIERLGDLGDLFRQFREMKKLTQEGLAERCGATVNRTQIALLEQGRRLPKPESLRAIAEQLGIPGETWAPFARDESHLRQQFEASVGELVGRVVGLRSMDIESVHAAEATTKTLFSGMLTATQSFDTLNSILLFYAVPRMSRAFFDRYLGGTAFQSIELFDAAIRRFHEEAIRLFSTFAEAYRKMNASNNLSTILEPLAARDLSAYTDRTVWDAPDPASLEGNRILPIPEHKLEFLGYISAAKYKAQKRKRETLAKYLRELAKEVRAKGPHALDEFGEKRRRKIDSLMRELGSTMAHTPISPLFVSNAANLENEANRILRDEKDEAEMERIQAQALSNLSHYISADHMDVYVATSMRSTSDFVSVNRFVARLFRHDQIAPLRLRYFNPTQSWIEDRVAKGLVEALMLRRASVTLYMAQKADSFGKDSEASVALGQGKPVIVYVPKLVLPSAGLDSESLMAETDLRLREMLLAQGRTAEDLDDLDHDGLFTEALTARIIALSDKQITEIVHLHWADFALLDESERIRGKDVKEKEAKDQDTDQKKDEDQMRRATRLREEYTKFVSAITRGELPELTSELRVEVERILVATTVGFEIRRARLFKEVHPLALQIILSTGVLNGILVSRSVDSCAYLLRGLLENKLQLELEPDDTNYRLLEKTTRSTVRVIARNTLLNNALDGLYDRL
ncbi:helix-turn-helix domain-containing protein [Sorangium cellulosum]|uniref:XRE family transcriptional regulator n=1 Tax=Sorangium cellulosum So0157-2 TaxID=1254432 RepID=S4XQ75_SORCE|nr:helix-turn-helix transcriptional regulator [Sorangium cellulosum]AGP32778.1 XRE family transcriptional regulator [Sorangium cellulosum So0157-2]